MEEFEKLIDQIDEFGDWPDLALDSDSEEPAYLEYA